MDIKGRGGGNNDDAAVVSMVPNPADPQTKELQPVTWLRAALYIVAVLAGVALLAVGMVLVSRSCSAGADEETINDLTHWQCDLGIVLLAISGGILVATAIAAPTALSAASSGLIIDEADD